MVERVVISSTHSVSPSDSFRDQKRQNLSSRENQLCQIPFNSLKAAMEGWGQAATVNWVIDFVTKLHFSTFLRDPSISVLLLNFSCSHHHPFSKCWNSRLLPCAAYSTTASVHQPFRPFCYFDAFFGLSVLCFPSDSNPHATRHTVPLHCTSL